LNQDKLSKPRKSIMGFNSTCSITRAEIAHADSIVLVILAESNWTTSKLRQKETPILHIEVGRYDFYGSIEGLKPNDSQFPEYWFVDRAIRIHELVAQRLLGRPLDPDRLAADFEVILNCCHTARIDLRTDNMLGNQFSTDEEIDLQRLILSTTSTLLERAHPGLQP
jgi:hypothetical protein